MPPSSPQNDGQNYNRQNDAQNQQQATTLVARGLLIPCRLSSLPISLHGVLVCSFHVVCESHDAGILLCHDVRNLGEEHVQVTDALLDIADFFLPLDNEAFLEIHLVLRRQLRQFLLLKELLLFLVVVDVAAGAVVVRINSVRGSGCADGGLFLVQGPSLEMLELLQRGLEVA